jgi:hypothetical protein
MNPITRALFFAIPDELHFDLESALGMLRSLDQRPERKGPFYVFDYIDDLHLRVCISTADQKRISTVSLTARLPGDEAGWSHWSKEKEAERLKVQTDWLSARSLVGGHISNLFSPQDGSSLIVIGR